MFKEDYLILNVKFQKPEGAFFEGECVPNLEQLEEIYTDWNREVYPHAWRGAILCFTLGLFVCVLTGINMNHWFRSQPEINYNINLY